MIQFLRSGRVTLLETYSYLTSEVRGLQAAAYILAFSSLLSSVLALLRDRILAHLFGAGIHLDLYYAAFRIPDLVFIAVGALVSAFMLIPEFSRRSASDQRTYLDTIIVGFSALVAVVAGGAAFAAPGILQTVFPALAATSLEELTLLTRILLLQAVLLGFSNIAAAVTQYKHRYALYAASPIVYNLGIIAGAVALYPYFGLQGLVWGVVAGAMLHVAIQVPPIVKDGFLRRMPRFAEPSAFFATVQKSLPRALALSMNQIAFFGLLSFAGALSVGSISVFMFAYNLQGVPLSIIGASFATAAFPTLATAYSRGDAEAFLQQVSLATRQILFWSMPTIALLVVLRAHIVRVILGTGAFDWTATRLTAAALALFALSLAAQGLTLLLIRAFYASGRTLTPFLISALSAGLTLILGSTFLGMVGNPSAGNFLEALLRVEGIPGTTVLVLALAYTTSSIISVLILALYFDARFRGFFAATRRAWWESLVAALGAGACAYATLHAIGDITLSSTLASVLLSGGSAGIAGCCAAALIYYALGSREFAENSAMLRKRLWRDVEPVASAEQSA